MCRRYPAGGGRARACSSDQARGGHRRRHARRKAAVSPGAGGAARGALSTDEDGARGVPGRRKGMGEAVEGVWPRTVLQTCIVHLMRDSFRYACHTGRKRRKRIAAALRAVYTAPAEQAAAERFAGFAQDRGDR